MVFVYVSREERRTQMLVLITIQCLCKHITYKCIVSFECYRDSVTTLYHHFTKCIFTSHSWRRRIACISNQQKNVWVFFGFFAVRGAVCNYYLICVIEILSFRLARFRCEWVKSAELEPQNPYQLHAITPMCNACEHC